MKAIGKIEEETFLTDLDQLEKDMESEIEDIVNHDATPQPQAQAAPQTSTMTVMTTGPKGQSKFTVKMQRRSAFFPDQPIPSAGKPAEPTPLVPLSYAEKRRKMKAPANDSLLAPAGEKSKFMTQSDSGGSRFTKKTMGALLALGQAPRKFLEDLGFFRYVKERQYNSLLRLERSLGQGYECAEQFLRTNPGALRKKDVTPSPAPTAP